MRMVLAHPIPQAVNVMRSPNRDSIVVWASTSTVPAGAAATFGAHVAAGKMGEGWSCQLLADACRLMLACEH